jgi:glycine dehydrogenase
MISIRKEIDQLALGEFKEDDNPLNNAPHTLEMISSDTWSHAYSRQVAAFPLDYLSENKFWPSVRRVDDAYGDRNLVCTCEPIEAYLD